MGRLKYDGRRDNTNSCAAAHGSPPAADRLTFVVVVAAGGRIPLSRRCVVIAPSTPRRSGALTRQLAHCARHAFIWSISACCEATMRAARSLISACSAAASALVAMSMAPSW